MEAFFYEIFVGSFICSFLYVCQVFRSRYLWKPYVRLSEKEHVSFWCRGKPRWPQWDKRAKGAVADFSFSLLQDEVEEAKKQKTEKNGSSNGKAVEVENGAEEEEEDGEEEEDLVEGEDEAEGEEEEDLVEGEDDEGEGKDTLKIYKNRRFTK